MTSLESASRLAAQLPGELPQPATLTELAAAAWPNATPLQKYVMIRYHGRAAERAAIKSFDRGALTWNLLIGLAFERGPLREELEAREFYLNDTHRLAAKQRRKL